MCEHSNKKDNDLSHLSLIEYEDGYDGLKWRMVISLDKVDNQPYPYVLHMDDGEYCGEMPIYYCPICGEKL